MARYGIVVDLNRCTGCMTCALACKAENETRPGIWWNRVLEVESWHLDRIAYVRYACMHCDNPPCVPACTQNAIYKRPDGIVAIDPDKCRASADCAAACPYGLIQVNPDTTYFPEDKAPAHPPAKASKCNLCSHRIDGGDLPACVASCPSRAMTFGDFDDPQSPVQEKLKHAAPLLEQEKTRPKVLYIMPENMAQTIEDAVREQTATVIPPSS